jgi:hypothetical protein
MAGGSFNLLQTVMFVMSRLNVLPRLILHIKLYSCAAGLVILGVK